MRSFIFIFTFLIVLGFVFFAKPTIDDLYFIGEIRSNGIFQPIINQYYGYSGRFIAFFLNDVVLFYKDGALIPISLLIQNALFIFSIYVYLKQFYSKHLFNEFITALIIYLFVLCGTNFGHEVLFWHTQCISYLLPVSAILITLSILSIEKNLILYLLLFSLSIIIAGSNETYALTGLLLTACMLYYFEKPMVKKIVLLILVIQAVVFIFMVSAPGNAVRLNQLDAENGTSSLNSIKFILLIFIYQKFSISGLIFLLFAILFSIKINQMKLFTNQFLILSGLMLFFVNFLPLALLFNDLPPARSLFFAELGLFFMLTSACSFFSWSVKRNAASQTITTISVICLFYLALGLVTAYNYSKKYNERKKNCAKTNGKIIINQVLPHCRFYYSAEITNDSTNYRNIHVQKGWDLKYVPILANETTK